METQIGKDLTRLIEDLERRSPEYSVFYAILLAEKISKKLYPQRDDAKFDQEGLRFKPYEHFVFPPKDIRSFEFRDGVMTFVLNFMGLYGINSPFPRCYSEQVALQQSVYGPGNVPLQNFLDIFNTRFYWLYYQAWKKYRYYLQFGFGFENKVMQRVFSFIGRGERKEGAKPKRINDIMLFRLSGILGNRLRNKKGLLILLREFYPGMDFYIREFVPHRVKLAVRPQMDSGAGDQAFRLSEFSTVGKSVTDLMGRICIEIGPLGFEDYLDFTPGTENAGLLRELMALYLNDGLEYDVRFMLKSDSIGHVSWSDRRLKLGVSFWMGRPKSETVDVYYTYERFSGAAH
jgi:type VI secretion system protein ImpH